MTHPDADSSVYTPCYHDLKQEGALRAANRILPIVFDLLGDVRSIVDVGCGYGTWLGVARDLGVQELVGIEGSWASHWTTRGVIPECVDLLLHDLETPTRLDRSFDLTLCLEVAEHLPAARGPGLVGDLCAFGPAVLFSAAIPHQGGTNHVNERWQSDWARAFEEQGFVPLDLVRPRIWNDPQIPFWYRQNALLFASREGASAIVGRAGRAAPPMLDIVHPEGWLGTRDVGIRERLRLALGLPKAAARRLRHMRPS